MQSVSRLASLTPTLAEAIQKAPSLAAAAATLANQRIADPLVWSQMFSLAKSESVTVRSEISYQALTAGKFYHSRMLRDLASDFSAFSSAREVLSVLRLFERLPATDTGGLFLRASEKLQTMEISSVQEISDVVHAFRRHPDERLFAHVLRRAGRKISSAEISDCVNLLENMGRAKLRELRTIHALIDAVLRESEISPENSGLHMRMLGAMEKLKIIYGRDRLLDKYSVEISDHFELSLCLEIAAAFNALGADTRKFIKFVFAQRQVKISDLPANMTTLRALSGGFETEISDLLARVLAQKRSPAQLKEGAEIFLANYELSEANLNKWPIEAVAALRDGVQEILDERLQADHVCAQRLRAAVRGTVASLVDAKQLAETSDFLGTQLTTKIGRATSAKTARTKRKTQK